MRKYENTSFVRQQHAPEAVRIVAVIGGVDRVLIERNRIGKLVRYPVDGRSDSELRQGEAIFRIELGDGHRLQNDLSDLTVARAQPQHVIDEVELDLKIAVACRDNRGDEAARAHAQRHVPGVVEPRRQRQPRLADDLRPELQRGTGIRPRCIRQFRPRTQPGLYFVSASNSAMASLAMRKLSIAAGTPA